MDPLKESAAKKAYEYAQNRLGENALGSAKSCLLQAVSYDDDDPVYYTLLGLVAYASGEFTKAKEYWRKASSDKYLGVFDSADFLDYQKGYDLCIDHIKEGKYTKAAVSMNRMIKKMPNTNGYRFLGLIFANLGLKKTAVLNWTEALKIDREDNLALEYILTTDGGKLPLFVEKVYMGVLSFGTNLKLL